MGIDDLVDLLHDADGFGKGNDNLLVVGDVIGGESVALCLAHSG